ncbi:hypothetical protein V8G54_012028 [Vigna mungo]|uniref:Uncharacterized protein n=1 Tax=Vigna mungo TaxID=3915 RepID=A0AAQ3S1U7_VIGMU
MKSNMGELWSFDVRHISRFKVQWWHVTCVVVLGLDVRHVTREGVIKVSIWRSNEDGVFWLGFAGGYVYGGDTRSETMNKHDGDDGGATNDDGVDVYAMIDETNLADASLSPLVASTARFPAIPTVCSPSTRTMGDVPAKDTLTFKLGVVYGASALKNMILLSLGTVLQWIDRSVLDANRLDFIMTLVVRISRCTPFYDVVSFPNNHLAFPTFEAVTMNPCTVLDCSPTYAEERGQDGNVEALGTFSAGVYREITTILSVKALFYMAMSSLRTRKIHHHRVPMLVTMIGHPVTYTLIVGVISNLFELCAKIWPLNRLRPYFSISLELVRWLGERLDRAVEKVFIPQQTDQPPSPNVIVVEERPFVRKRKGGGMWGPNFNIGHKIDFNLDETKKKGIEGMTEQQMADIAMELTCRVAMGTWHLAYASDRGILRIELERVKKQLNEVVAAHSQCRILMGNLQRFDIEMMKACDQLVAELEVLRKEAFDQKNAIGHSAPDNAEDKELKEEMGKAITNLADASLSPLVAFAARFLAIATVRSPSTRIVRSPSPVDGGCTCKRDSDAQVRCGLWSFNSQECDFVITREYF